MAGAVELAGVAIRSSFFTGLGSTWGPLIGAATLTPADEGRKEFQDWRVIGMGRCGRYS